MSSPAISTGVYGFPKRPAPEIAARCCIAEADGGSLSRIVLCCFSDDDTQNHAEAPAKEAEG